MTAGRVSVVIPMFNAARFVRAAIGSVLAQGEHYAQIIAVDDGSTDDSAQLAGSFPAVTVIRQPNGGIGSARNAGVALATGELLAFLDADDLWPDGRLAAMISTLDADRSIDAVFGSVVQFGDGLQDSEPAAGRLASCMLVRRAAYDRVGPFNEALRVGEFIDWWARAEEAGVTALAIPDVTLRRRIHTTNTGIVHADSRVDYARVLRATLERRRHQG